MSGKLEKYELRRKTEDKVIKFYHEHPEMSSAQLAQALDLHVSTILRYLMHLPGYQKRKALARKRT